MADVSSSKFTAWSSDGKHVIECDNPNRIDVIDVADEILFGSVAFIEPEEVALIQRLKDTLSDEKDKSTMSALYERLK